jgi:hypothetical protein
MNFYMQCVGQHSISLYVLDAEKLFFGDCVYICMGAP